MRLFKIATCALILAFAMISRATAQDETLRFVTVERPPFAFQGPERASGFSIELMIAIGNELRRDVTFEFEDEFSGMLEGVESSNFDGAIANISITAARERTMDFSQPIFESGIGVLVPEEMGQTSLLSAIFTWDLLILILAALGLLFGAGMLMWMFERRAQPYFDRPANDALFPSFWWALNLVVNGGFEERMPQSRMGRVFSVFLVVSSLFIVSIFVANITAAMTVGALQSNVSNLSDLERRKVATIGGSTSANFLDDRDIKYTAYNGSVEMLEAFENLDVDVVVFDVPILAYHISQGSDRNGYLLDRTYKPESYAIALPPGSPIREEIDQTLLELRENGTYDALLVKWFAPQGG